MPVRRLLVLLLLVTACGPAPDDAEPVTFDSATPSASTSSTPPAAIDPATALPLTGTAGKDLTRPVVATVLRHAQGSVPVLGADAADIVFQQPGKGAQSRLVALYQSSDAAKAGPIGTPQPSDAALLALLRPAYAYSGGSERFVSQLTGLVQITPGRPGFASISGHTYASTATLRTAAAGAGRPLRLLTYGDPGQPVAEGPSTAVKSVTVTIPGLPAQVWTRGAAGWAQSGAGAPKVTVANLIVAATRYRDLRSDKGGTLVAEPNVFGTGSVTVVSGDMLAKGAWSRPTKNATFAYADQTGVPMRFAPGRTWILMAPPGTTVTGR